MFFIELDSMACCESEPVKAENPLETGFINHGSTSKPSDAVWYNASEEASYGDGRRYSHEETRFITKVPSKHGRNRGK